MITVKTEFHKRNDGNWYEYDGERNKWLGPKSYRYIQRMIRQAVDEGYTVHGTESEHITLTFGKENQCLNRCV